jgi:Domain of unknown function (DUF7014)/AbiJ N-terminal domain 4
MSIYETFSKRMKRLSNHGQEDVYQFDELPRPFRVQVIHIWTDAIGPVQYRGEYSTQRWSEIHKIMAREMGMFSLGKSDDNAFEQCQDFLLKASTEHALDLIELTFRVIDRQIRRLPLLNRRDTNITQDPDEAIKELNHRFREHNIGYQFESSELIRVDSQFVHAEMVKPVLALLHETGFKGAQEEFLKAHEHYRHGRSKEAIAEALKAFESTMKTICDARKWPYRPNATAKPLLEILFDKGLIPSTLQSHFTAFRTTLEAGLPTVRNKTSGHGQGAQPVVIPDYMASYALHLAATNILMLVQAHNALP